MNAEHDEQSESFADLFSQSAGGKTRRKRLSVGDELEVTVVKVTHDSVFVDLHGKAEAYMEMADFNDASGQPIEIKPGMQLRARVAELGSRTGATRLTPLALRSAQDDSASQASAGASATAIGNEPVIAAGIKITGTVSRVESYGVFIQIQGTQGRQGRGLLPISEMVRSGGADPRKNFAVGQTVEAKIIAIDEQGRIRLSAKALLADAERAEYQAYAHDASKPSKGQPVGFGTLGDLLAKRKPASSKR